MHTVGSETASLQVWMLLHCL